MPDDIRPFITEDFRVDSLAMLAREHSRQVGEAVDQVISRGIRDELKKDGKDGTMEGGDTGFWDKKDGKDGKDKEKDGKESKEGKEGKDSKEGKEGKEGKESKDGKESKEGKESKDGKEGGKEGKESKEGKDKDKDKDKDGDGLNKPGGDEGGTLIRYGDELVLPVGQFEAIGEGHSVRLAALLNRPII